MIRLIRLAVSMMAIAVVVYFAVTVPLGQKTLWQHIRAIASTEESQQLVEGVKTKAEQVLESSDAQPDRGGADGATGDQQRDEIDPEEQQKLRKLIRERLDTDGEAAETAGVRPTEPTP